MDTILNSPVISRYICKEKIEAYAKDLEAWLIKHHSRKYLGFTDHFAIKVENEKTFNEVVEAFKSYCIESKGEAPGTYCAQNAWSKDCGCVTEDAPKIARQ
jgi:hypothetical protein